MEGPLVSDTTEVLSGASPAPEDVEECNKLQADAFHRKPAGFAKYDELARSISNFWLRNAKLSQLGGH